jgi:hypothetical protein
VAAAPVAEAAVVVPAHRAVRPTVTATAPRAAKVRATVAPRAMPHRRASARPVVVVVVVVVAVVAVVVLVAARRAAAAVVAAKARA